MKHPFTNKKKFPIETPIHIFIPQKKTKKKSKNLFTSVENVCDNFESQDFGFDCKIFHTEKKWMRILLPLLKENRRM